MNFPELRTHCKKCNTEWTKENTIVRSDGTRQCKNCSRVNAREQNALRKQAQEALGLKQREYIVLYGSSKATARAIIAKS